jgi:DNA-binding transcriptional MerR regulator
MANLKNTFSIRQVIELTGVSEFTIRGWENRYATIHPLRTESGRRVYAREDVLKIKILNDLVAQGHRISTIANKSYEELVTLTLEDKIELPKSSKEVRSIITYAEKFEWSKILKILERKFKALKPKDFLLGFLLDLIGSVNALVNDGKFSIAQEHILSAMIKEKLYALKAMAPTPTKTNYKILFATPEGELHEIGLLIAAALASHSRIPNLYIGPNTPKESLSEVALRYKATHIILSSTISQQGKKSEDLLTYINFLDRQLPRKIHFWIGGPFVGTHPFSLERPHKFIQDLTEQNEIFTEL